MYSPRTVDKLNEVAHRYKPIIQKAIHDVLADQKYRNTGAGAASVTVDVIEGDTTKSPVIHIEFDDYMHVMGVSKPAWTRLPNMKKLLEWSHTKTNDPKKAKRLAWLTPLK